jgi:hypothetical protein
MSARFMELLLFRHFAPTCDRRWVYGVTITPCSESLALQGSAANSNYVPRYIHIAERVLYT